MEQNFAYNNFAASTSRFNPEKNRDLLRNFPKEKRRKKRKKTGRILSSSVSPLHGCWGGFLSWRDRVSPLGGSVEKGGKGRREKEKLLRALIYFLSSACSLALITGTLEKSVERKGYDCWNRGKGCVFWITPPFLLISSRRNSKFLPSAINRLLIRRKGGGKNNRANEQHFSQPRRNHRCASGRWTHTSKGVEARVTMRQRGVANYTHKHTSPTFL